MTNENTARKKHETGHMQTHYHGHRQRLKDRFRRGGANVLQDYELLELLLFRPIPRKDTKPLAKALLKKFGSFSEVINAPENLLKEVPGVGEAVITEFHLVKACSQHMLRQDIADKPVMNNWDTLIEYCYSQMAFEKVEQFRIIFLDKRNKVIADEVQGIGTVDHTPVYVREVAKRSLELSATAIILVHNHPSGDPTPSKADIDMTKKIAKTTEGLGIVIHDHIIIGKDGYFSFRKLGLL